MQMYSKALTPMVNPYNEELLNNYLSYLKLQNRNASTIYNYSSVLVRFFSRVVDPIPDMTSVDIQQLLQQDREQVRASTIKYRLAVLSSFFTFCVKLEFMLESPVKRPEPSSQKHPLVFHISKKKLVKFRQITKQEPLLDQLLMEFLLLSGCRISQARHLNYEDVDLANRRIRMTIEEGHIQEIELNTQFIGLCKRYLQTHPKTSKALFVTKTGKRLSHKQLRHIIYDTDERTGIRQGLFARYLQHEYGTQLNAKGVDLCFTKDTEPPAHLYTKHPMTELNE